MKRRMFLRTGLAAGVAGLASPSLLSGANDTLGTAPAARPRFGPLGRIPDPPIRLQFNENPRGLAPAAKQAMIDNFDTASLYGTPLRGRIQQMIAESHGVETGFIAMGNGSGDTLRQAPQAIGKDGMHLIAADPTYGDIFGATRQFANVKVTRIPPRADHSHNIAAMRRAAMEPAPVTLVYICQPNNPTGALTPSAEIERWIEDSDEGTTFFVIDEAYHHYVTDPSYRSSDHLTRDRRNVIVARTFSKIYAMAGLRLGYGIAHPDTARRMQALFGGGVSHLTAAAAIASMEDPDWERESVRLNEEAKRITFSGLDALGIEYIPTECNFFMHRIKGDANEHRSRMREQGLIVGRDFPPMLEYSRVTFGMPEEMEYFVETLRTLRAQSFI
jgi:histidinol-phosphate aminotransferase